MEALLAAQARDRQPWFERKAIVLAAMNHPNIAIIHRLKITATNARATNEEEPYETTPMENLGARSSSREPN